MRRNPPRALTIIAVVRQRASTQRLTVDEGRLQESALYVEAGYGLPQNNGAANARWRQRLRHDRLFASKSYLLISWF